MSEVPAYPASLARGSSGKIGQDIRGSWSRVGDRDSRPPRPKEGRRPWDWFQTPARALRTRLSIRATMLIVPCLWEDALRTRCMRLSIRATQAVSARPYQEASLARETADTA